MTDLERIKQSTPLQMELSEMLFKALWHEQCWHKWKPISMSNLWRCYKGGFNCCGKEIPIYPGEKPPPNPNLFSDWTGFGIVWEAVKDRQDFNEEFCAYGDIETDDLEEFIHISNIATPDFQLEVLKWLVGEKKVQEMIDENN